MFLKTGITPDVFYEKPRGVQAFMLASTRIYLESNTDNDDTDDNEGGDDWDVG